MRSIQKGWVVVGVAALFGLHAIGTIAAQMTSDTLPALAQQEGPTGTAAAPPEKPASPQSWYEAIAERVHLGGYGSFRYEGSTLDDSEKLLERSGISVETLDLSEVLG